VLGGVVFWRFSNSFGGSVAGCRKEVECFPPIVLQWFVPLIQSWPVVVVCGGVFSFVRSAWKGQGVGARAPEFGPPASLQIGGWLSVWSVRMAFVPRGDGFRLGFVKGRPAGGGGGVEEGWCTADL